MSKQKDFITIGYYKGEMDFGVNCGIEDLSLEEFDKLRIMTMVAIGQAERMWGKSRGEKVGFKEIKQ